MPLPQSKPCFHCDFRLLSGYLDSELSLEERDWVEVHLGQCNACAEKIEHLAADTAFWSTATTALNTRLASDTPSRPLIDLSLDALVSCTNQTSNGEFSLGMASLGCAGDAGIVQMNMLARWLDPTEMPESIGRIGKYEVLGVAGIGGMGLVLKAIDTELNRIVALKTMAHHVTARADARSRLAREARAVAALRHPNVISIFGLETWRDVPLIVMPFVEGGTLQQFASKQQLSNEQVIQAALQIADALTSLHASGIVHRDLKPSNILLQEGLDHLLLSDFGLARIDGDESITQTDALAGTPYFMSPEQAIGRTINTKSDLFSFGSVLYWLCSGTYPFRGNSNYETLTLLVHGQPDFDRLTQQQVPDCLQRVIQRLCAKDPNDRWVSVEQVRELLQACLEQTRNPSTPLPAELTTPNPIQSRARRWPSGVASALVALAIVVGGVGVTTIWFLMNSTRIQDLAMAKMDSATSDINRDLEPEPAREPFSMGQRNRYGILDELDQRVMLDELKSGENLHYWLRRLAYLPVENIPTEALPLVQTLCDHHDLATRELSQVILNKNPFQEVTIPTSPISQLENPFQEVLKNE